MKQIKNFANSKYILLFILALLLLVLVRLNVLSINIPIGQRNRDLDLDGYIDSDYGGDDCDDEDARVNPGAQDIPDDGINQDCKGGDSSLFITDKDDLDGDGFPSAEDCDDTDENVNPKAREIYNLIDDNCRSGTDEGFNSIVLLKDFVIPDYSSGTIIKTSKSIVSTGNISEAYLYIKAGVDNPLRPLTKYDSIYLYFDLPETSGHFIGSESLNTETPGDNLTTLVYDTKNILFRGSSNPKNLLAVLNRGGQYNIGAFVATERFGQVVELVLAYKGGSIVLK